MHDGFADPAPGTFYEMWQRRPGLRMAAAVGVALAWPEARTSPWSATGRRMYTIQALWNAAQMNLRSPSSS